MVVVTTRSTETARNVETRFPNHPRIGCTSGGQCRLVVLVKAYYKIFSSMTTEETGRMPL